MNKKCARDRNAMVKKVSLNISDDNYKKLASLGDFYDQDVEETITSILDAVGSQAGQIINLSKEYKVPVKLITVIYCMLDAGLYSIYGLFNKVLERLEVKGLYTLEDFGIDLDEYFIWIWYNALPGCNLKIDGFYVRINGLKYLDTKSYIDAEKVDDETLYDIIQSVEVPEEFYDLDYSFQIGGDEELLTLEIEFVTDSLYYLPSLKIVSEFVEQVFKKVGIRNCANS